MSLTATPNGLIARKHPTGCLRANKYTILAGYATAIGHKDPVILNTNGSITVGTAAADLLGTFAGVSYKDSTGKPTFRKDWPGAVSGATDIQAWVYDDPETIYEVQVGAGGTGYVQAVIGDQADIVIGTPSSVGESTSYLNATPAGAGVQAQFRVVDFGPDGVYDATLNPFPTVLVQLARHQFRSNKVGI